MVLASRVVHRLLLLALLFTTPVGVLFLFFAPPLNAQSKNASLTGRITDSSKGVVPNALVVAINTGTRVHGCMDAVVSCLGGPPVLLLNRGGGANHLLSISLQGTRSNRDGFGARVSVNGQTRFATSAGSYLCANDKRLHFGLGPAEKATVEILWPSGVKQVLNNVRADQFFSVREPERS